MLMFELMNKKYYKFVSISMGNKSVNIHENPVKLLEDLMSDEFEYFDIL